VPGPGQCRSRPDVAAHGGSSQEGRGSREITPGPIRRYVRAVRPLAGRSRPYRPHTNQSATTVPVTSNIRRVGGWGCTAYPAKCALAVAALELSTARGTVDPRTGRASPSRGRGRRTALLCGGDGGLFANRATRDLRLYTEPWITASSWHGFSRAHCRRSRPRRRGREDARHPRRRQL
jgi:hypothetical protein